MVNKEIATPSEGVFVERVHEDPPHPEGPRNAFQHDRDRIIHSTIFRRLQYKTQVYMFHEGDMYRTRMTHTLEVAQIARGLAQLLEADCDLAEAIALAHDVGHTPFGHAGENALRDLLKPHCVPFNHNIQSYRVLSKLEERYSSYSGLNLTYAVYEGVLRHNTFFDKAEEIRESITGDIRDEVSKYWDSSQPGIEAQIVNMADVIAYATHDIEDALAVGLISWKDFKKRISEQVVFVFELMSEVDSETDKKVKEARRNEEWALKVCPRILSNKLIAHLIREAVEQTNDNISRLDDSDAKLYNQIRSLDEEVVTLPPSLGKQVRILVKDILRNEVYKEPRVVIMEEKTKIMLKLLFETFIHEPRSLPKNTQARLRKYEEEPKNGKNNLSKDKIRSTVIGDYISGMTDKYAMDLYQLLTQPYEKAL